MSKSKRDVNRKWLWYFLGAIAAFQLYFVRELLAAFALFILVFAAFGSVIATVYMFHKVWEAGVLRLVKSRHPWLITARRAVSSVEDYARRPLRRPGSQPTSA
jgi:hypothetical protein